jgi:hypothetical protein
MSGRQQKPRIVYQKLTCIRQTGIQRQFDGTVIYTFAAQVSKELAPVMITLMITEEREVQVQARFDETLTTTFTAGEEPQPSLLEGKSA